MISFCMRPFLAGAAALLLFTAGDGVCSQVVFLPLHEAVRPETIVFRARVTSLSRNDGRDLMTTLYGLEGVTVLRGPPTVSIKSGSYAEIVPVMRDATGKIVGHFSPVLRASGAEREVKKGTEVFFFADSIDAKGVARVIRVESLSNRKAIDALLSKQAPVKKP